MNVLRRLWYSLRHRNVDADLAEELESHRAMAQARLEDAGLSPRDAAAESRRIMGTLTLAREDARTERVVPWLDSAWQDLRYRLRSAAHQPGFAAVAIGTLAVAIGLNTTLFTIYNALVLAPWPVGDPAGVVTIHNTSAADVRFRGGGAPGGFSFDEGVGVGVAGVFAYVVQQRTHEIGVHVALGARVSHIVGVVVRSSLLAIAGGAVTGLVGAFLASGLLRSYLFGLSAADPLAHLGVLVVLAVAGAAATFVPARNAARIEPVNALRHE